MASTMNTLVTELSKEIGDWFEVTASGGSTSTVASKAIAQQQNDWVSDGSDGQRPSTVYVKTDAGAQGGAPEGEERYVSSKATDTITTNATHVFSAAIAASDIAEVHRKFTRREKEDAIKYGCRLAFPSVYKKVRDTSISFNNWLRNSDFEVWSQTGYPDYWRASTVTAAQNTTAQYIRTGSSSLQLSGSAGYLYAAWNPGGTTTGYTDLQYLSGASVHAYAWVWTNTASSVRLTIADGTTPDTDGSYHTGGSGWELIDVSDTITDNPTKVEGRINYLSGTCYVDSAWMDSGRTKYSYDISDLGLHLNAPSQIFVLPSMDMAETDPNIFSHRVRLHCWEMPNVDSRLRFTRQIPDGSKLEIIGMGYLTIPTSLYGDSTSSTSTEADEPQLRIIIAEAAKYLYEQSLHYDPTVNVERAAALVGYWDNQCRERRSKFSLPAIPPTRRE